MDDQEFRKASDTAMDGLRRALEQASEDFDFDVDSKEGALAVEFDDPPAKFVVSPNSPVRQIWVSARVKSFKLDWNPVDGVFSLPDGRTLAQLMGDVIGEQLGEAVVL
jgi:CyaY protein